MSLYEHVPYTNFENINLDWLLSKTKELEATVQQHTEQIGQIQETLGTIDGRITVIEGDITNIQQEITEINETIENLDIDEITRRITEINEQITIIEGELQDLQGIWAAIERNNDQSIARDDDLSRRISLLEQATIHPIDIYTGTENLILWGSDFRQLPSSAKDEYGYPIGAPVGNAEGSAAANPALMFDDYGYTVNPEGSGYTYLTLGRINDIPRSSDTLSMPITVTLGILTGTPSMSQTPTEIVKTVSSLNQNISLLSEFGSNVYLRLDFNSSDKYFTLDIRGTAANMTSAFTNKHLCYCRVEYGSSSAGVRFNNHDSKIASLIAQASGALTPSEVEAIVHDNLADIVGEEVFDHAYNVNLVPADGSASYSIPAELDLRLTWKLGFLSGILAINIPMDAAEMDIDLSKSFDMLIDISALEVPPKTIRADTIHFYSDLFTGAQFDLVLNSSLSKLNSMRVWGAMRPIHLTGAVGDKKTIAVIKIFEPSVWTQPTPDTP